MSTTMNINKLLLTLAFTTGVLLANAQDVLTIEQAIQIALENNFDIGLYLLLPLVAVLYMAYKKKPAFPAIVVGAMVGVVFAIIFQRDTIEAFVGASDRMQVIVILDGIWQSLFAGHALLFQHYHLCSVVHRLQHRNSLAFQRSQSMKDFVHLSLLFPWSKRPKW